MADLPIDKQLAEQIEAVARDENRSVGELLADMLTRYMADAHPARHRAQWARELARMADEDSSPVWQRFAPDLAARSRQILDDEFADYLRGRTVRTDE